MKSAKPIICPPFFCRSRPSNKEMKFKEFVMNATAAAFQAIPPLPAKATVDNSETWQRKKKFTVYKVLVTCQGRTWTYFRRYNEFHKLYQVLKKHFPGLRLKLPGKKLFGNNFDPPFVRSRRDGLNEFVQQLVSNQQLFQHPHVRDFLGLTSSEQSSSSSSPEELGDDASDKDVDVIDKSMNLGTSEKLHAKPSDFEFLKVIGKGSFGKVLLAKHKCDGHIYAVKVLQKKTVSKRKSHIMSERNVLLKNLDHPFLVGLHFSFQTTQKLYFVLDYANGGELFFHLQQEHHFSEPRAKFYAAEMASAIGYLHQQGIVYRDLKPENILLDCQGHIVLTDFGLCKEGILRESDTTSTFCGTPEYLAPEVLRKHAYGRSVDWWCLGVVLYEMLYGLPPFYSKDTAEMYDNILNKPLRLRATCIISLEAKSILEELLEKDKEKRLGAGSGDLDDVKCHDFFSSINWIDLVAKRIDPPYHPNLSGLLDLRNIDPEFTKEPVPASVGQSIHSITNLNNASVSTHQNDPDQTDTCNFDGFSYMANGPHLTL